MVMYQVEMILDLFSRNEILGKKRTISWEKGHIYTNASRFFSKICDGLVRRQMKFQNSINLSVLNFHLRANKSIDVSARNGQKNKMSEE